MRVGGFGAQRVHGLEQRGRPSRTYLPELRNSPVVISGHSEKQLMVQVRGIWVIGVHGQQALDVECLGLHDSSFIRS